MVNLVTIPSSPRLRLSPVLLLILGILAGAATAITGFTTPGPLSVALGAATAVIAIWLTFLIASRQADESSDLQATVSSVDEAVSQMRTLLIAMAEQQSAQQYDPPEEEEEPEPQSDAGRPDYSDAVIEKLRADGFPITQESAGWRRKLPLPLQPGNHGWFVESTDPGTPGRWYVRNARGLTVRKAMPREFLDELEKQKSVDPRTIKLDFQLKEHGLAAWYARTYSGDLWKVWRPARKWSDGIKIEQVEDPLS